MPARVTIIGAGGYVFPLVLIRDLFAHQALRDIDLRLHDIDRPRAERTAEGARRLIEQHGLGASILVTTDLDRAVEGADVVICAFQVGGIEAYREDVEIPRRYGIDQPVGDTLGPGGVFRGLRSIAALKPIAQAIRRLAPGALLIQYANPMSMNCWATERLGVRTVGLCHSVQGTSRMLASQIGVDYDKVVYDCAGVNHTAWFTTFRHVSGEDLIPRIREVMGVPNLAEAVEERPDELHGGGHERVRSELMSLTGYFHTESSHHASEYWAWFRKDEATVAQYLPQRWDYFEICSNHAPDEQVENLVESSREALVPSLEYGSGIVDSLISGTPRIIYGNVPNVNLITNLPADACVEVACHVDRLGVRPIHYGTLPAACAALNLVQINVQRLAVEAALTGDPNLVHAAVALDPLTSAHLTLPRIRSMVNEMFAAETAWLPDFPAPARRKVTV